MRRILPIVAFVFMCAAATAQPALADPPVREPAPAFDYVDTTSCAFPVSVDFTFDRGKITIFSNGDAIITGALKATLTNTVTGKSIDVNIPGPVKFTANADGSFTLMATGRFLGPLNGILTLFSGRLFEPIYGSHDVTLSGRAIDVCVLLAR